MAATMGFYGVQFEALMKEVCVDFGRRLIRGWDEGADKDEVLNYVMESAELFFKRAEGLEGSSKGIAIKAKMTIEKVDVDETESVPKKKAPAKKKAKAPFAVPDSPTGMTDTEEEKSKKSKLGRMVKKGGGEKKKCEGVTAKGTQCSKCAIDGEVFCNVHLKKKDDVKEKKAPAKEKKAPAKKGKGKKKEEPVHDHEIGKEPGEEGCELCETHGEAFEMPEYEVMDDEFEEKDDERDVDWKLEEEEFDDV